MSNINFSVIIPCYNGWKYMSNCFAYLEEQSLKPYEIIIVDDCSSDDSYERISEYSRSSSLNIVLLKNEKNSGPGASREYAIKASSGDYITFCDCDDWYEKSFLELMQKAIQENNADIAICDNYITYDDRKAPAGITKPLLDADKPKIMALYPMSLCRLAVKRPLFDGIVCPHIYNGEDGAIVPQLMAKADTIVVIDTPLYNYYFRDGSASTKPRKNAYIGMLKAFEAVERIKESYPVECEFLGAKAVCYAAVLNAYKAGVKTKEIKPYLKKFKQSYPKWNKNQYLKYYGQAKRIYLKCVSMNMFFMCKILTKMHSFMAKRR